MTLEQIAKKHNVPTTRLQAQLKMGLSVEREHYSDIAHRTKIALDHLEEIPDYYTRLKEMEMQADKSAVKPGSKMPPPNSKEDNLRVDKAWKSWKGAGGAAVTTDEPGEKSEEVETELPTEKEGSASAHMDCGPDCPYTVGQSVSAVVSEIEDMPDGGKRVKFDIA